MATVTLRITAPELKTVTRALASDWGPALHTAARRIAAVVVVIYTAWVMAHDAWHRLAGWAQAHQLIGLTRMGLPGGTSSELQVFPRLEVAPVRVQRLAPAAPPAPSIGIAQPRANAVEMLAADGMSQRAIARQLGISRHKVKAILG